MARTISQRIVDQLPWLDDVAEKTQPKVREVIDRGGVTLRNVLDGVWFEIPLHPVLTDVPIGSGTATLLFDGLNSATGSKATRNAADATLALGIAGGVAAAVTGLSDWRYLSGGSRRMGVAHGLLNTAELTLSIASLALRAKGSRNAGRLTFLTGFSISAAAAHLGGEFSYKYGLRVNRNVFEQAGPDEYVPVLEESELSDSGMRRVEVDGVGVLLSRARGGKVCAIAATCNHFSGPLEEGDREGDTVVCPWHKSRFDLCTGQAIDGPAVFPQSLYHARVRDGQIEVKAAADNIQKKVR